MQPLKFNFGHPVKGRVRFVNKAEPGHLHVMPLYVNTNHEAIISLDNLSDGKWNVAIEWEYDGRNYVYSENFEINAVSVSKSVRLGPETAK